MNWLFVLPKTTAAVAARTVTHEPQPQELPQIEGWKECTRCRGYKPFEDFYWKSEPRLSEGGRYSAQCQACLKKKREERKLRREKGK